MASPPPPPPDTHTHKASVEEVSLGGRVDTMDRSSSIMAGWSRDVHLTLAEATGRFSWNQGGIDSLRVRCLSCQEPTGPTSHCGWR